MRGVVVVQAGEVCHLPCSSYPLCLLYLVEQLYNLSMFALDLHRSTSRDAVRPFHPTRTTPATPLKLKVQWTAILFDDNHCTTLAHLCDYCISTLMPPQVEQSTAHLLLLLIVRATRPLNLTQSS